MEKIDVRLYLTQEGRKPFMVWLNRLKDHNTRAAIYSRIGRARLGNLGDTKALGDGVHEMRLTIGAGYRLYFGRDGATIIILLCGGDKASQRRDVSIAKQYWVDYRRRKDAGESEF